MRLNLGSGFNKLQGYVNVDTQRECNPDIVHNLETFPWPFEDNSVGEIRFYHSLEHMGQDPKVFLKLIQEVYRVCRNNANIEIVVPHPRHDNFISDPTHVRAITPMTLELFDLELNKRWQAMGAANSCLAIYLNVNLKLIKHTYTVESKYWDKFARKQISNNELQLLMKERNNIVSEYQFYLTAIK